MNNGQTPHRSGLTKHEKWHYNMLTTTTVWILNDLALEPAELRVLIFVIHAAGRDKPDFVCYDTRVEIAEATGLHRNTVGRCLARLKNLGMIESDTLHGREYFQVVELSDWPDKAFKKGSKVLETLRQMAAKEVHYRGASMHNKSARFAL
jgi:DNA-binding MarR family transcriptional regulator